MFRIEMRKYNSITMTEEVTITKQHIILYKIGMLETIDIVDKGQADYMPLFFREVGGPYSKLTLNETLDRAPYILMITK